MVWRLPVSVRDAFRQDTKLDNKEPDMDTLRKAPMKLSHSELAGRIDGRRKIIGL